MARKSAKETRFFRSISALLVMSLCGLFVFPVPLVEIGGRSGGRGVAGKDTSVPFPCMLKACGCRNAEDCWRGCCCFTNTQKLAWARKNSVDVPAYVVDAARHEQPSADSPDSNGDSDSDGNWLSLLATLFVPAKANPGADCCSKSSDASCSSSSDADCCTPPSNTSRNVSLKLVSTVRALQCRGLSLTLALVSTMMVSLGPQVELTGGLPDFLFTLTSETLPDTTRCAPLPPPRLRGV